MNRVVDGRYELQGLLGSGTGGEVWAARQRSVERTVAIKLLTNSEDELFAVRFAREARAIALLNHPNIVTLFDYGYDPTINTYFMVMEHADGTVLAEAMFDPLPIELRVRLIRDIACALRHAHAHGVLHRDLKPENVILTPSDESGELTVKVLDFGLARVLGLEELTMPVGLGEETTDARITQLGEVQGTPAYMSPEQALGSLDVGPKTDIYSLGVMLYELLHARLPFMADDPWDVIGMQLEASPEVSDAVPAIPGDVIRAMMSKAPDDRPDAAAVIERLDAYLDRGRQRPGADDSIVYGDGFVLEEEEEENDPRRRNVALILLMLVVLGAVSSVFLSSEHSDDAGRELEQVATEDGPSNRTVSEQSRHATEHRSSDGNNHADESESSRPSEPNRGFDARIRPSAGIESGPAPSTPDRSTASERTEPADVRQRRTKRPRPERREPEFEEVDLVL